MHIAGVLVEAYVLGRLPEAEVAGIEEHLIVCAECRGRLIGWGEYVRFWDELDCLLQQLEPQG